VGESRRFISGLTSKISRGGSQGSKLKRCGRRVGLRSFPGCLLPHRLHFPVRLFGLPGLIVDPPLCELATDCPECRSGGAPTSGGWGGTPVKQVTEGVCIYRVAHASVLCEAILAKQGADALWGGPALSWSPATLNNRAASGPVSGLLSACQERGVAMRRFFNFANVFTM